MIDAASLLTTIPHHPPFLFVDEVVSVSNETIRTRTRVRPDADFFRGHYPGNPVMPGVLLCECCFQSGAMLMAYRRGGWNAADGIPVLTKIVDARFRRIVTPGERLETEVSLNDEVDRAFYMTGKITVADQPVLRVSFTCMLAINEGRLS